MGLLILLPVPTSSASFLTFDLGSFIIFSLSLYRAVWARGLLGGSIGFRRNIDVK